MSSSTRILEIDENEVRQKLNAARPDIERWKQVLLAANEYEAIRLMDEIIAHYGDVVFRWGTSQIESTFTIDGEKVAVSTNPFMIAAYHGMLMLAEKLLDENLWPYDPDLYLKSFVSSGNPVANRISPMMVAIMANQRAVADLLMCHRVQPSPVIDGTKSEIGGARRRGWSAVVDYLIQNTGVLTAQQIRGHLELMRSYYFSEPGWNKAIDDDCMKLREAWRERVDLMRVPELRDASIQNDVDDGKYYDMIYGDYPDNRKDKQSVLRRVNIKLAQLLRDPQKCRQYLKFLNDEFVRYHAYKTGQNIPEPDRAHFSFKDIGHTWYPIPDKDYHGNKNHGTLSEFLCALFRQHGIAGRAVKWLGFIEQKAADEMVRRGDFISESTFGAPALLHGKLSHMIQTAILIYAVQSGEIDLEYDDDGLQAKLTMNEILASQVDPNSPRKPAGVWELVRDTRAYNVVTFADPHRLQSVLMRDGAELGAAELSHYMIDSFCKGFLKSYHAASLYISDLGDLDEYAEKMSDLAANGYEIPYYLQDYGRSYYKNKTGLLFTLFNATSVENAVAIQVNPKDGFTHRSFAR